MYCPPNSRWDCLLFLLPLLIMLMPILHPVHHATHFTGCMYHSYFITDTAIIVRISFIMRTGAAIAYTIKPHVIRGKTGTAPGYIIFQVLSSFLMRRLTSVIVPLKNPGDSISMETRLAANFSASRGTSVSLLDTYAANAVSRVRFCQLLSGR
jgi:hypothetical protein